MAKTKNPTEKDDGIKEDSATEGVQIQSANEKDSLMPVILLHLAKVWKEEGAQVMKSFPDRLEALAEILSSNPFTNPDLTGMFQSGLRRASSKIPVNPFVAEMFTQVQPVLAQFASDVGILKIMFNSELKQMNDDLDEALGEKMATVLVTLSKVAKFSSAEHENWSRYHQARNDMLEKIESGHENAVKAVNDIDSMIILHLRSTVRQLVGFYLALSRMTEEASGEITHSKKANFFESMFS